MTNEGSPAGTMLKGAEDGKPMPWETDLVKERFFLFFFGGETRIFFFVWSAGAFQAPPPLRRDRPPAGAKQPRGADGGGGGDGANAQRGQGRKGRRRSRRRG